jgi:hypothetical protein
VAGPAKPDGEHSPRPDYPQPNAGSGQTGPSASVANTSPASRRERQHERPRRSAWLPSTAMRMNDSPMTPNGGPVPDPLADEAIGRFFKTLLPGAEDAIGSVITGKVGLALSGGGFRASFFHLGVLACLAERNALRDIVLSCVSGGSIVGACYRLKLRQRLKQSPPPKRDDYITLVHDLIRHFEDAVRTDPRRKISAHALRVEPGVSCTSARPTAWLTISDSNHDVRRENSSL